MTEESTLGLVVLCAADGTIRQVLTNHLAAARPLQAGKSIFDWIDEGSSEKMRFLFAEVLSKESVFDWELNVGERGRMNTLHFSGVANEDGVLIVAAPSLSAFVQLYEGLMKMNNEQVNALRSAIQEQTRLARELNQRDTGLYDQLSRLNNELIVTQRELAKKNVELEALNRQKNQFLGMAAHDLRSPLSAIITYSGFLAQDITPYLNEDQKEILDIINRSSMSMRALIEDLLDVSAIEAGQLILRPQATQLDELVKHVIKIHQALAGPQTVITFACAPNLPQVFVDRAKIEQVLNNLISNAVKYSPPASPIEIALTQQADSLLLMVRDHGQGISAAEMPRLGKAFSKTSARSTNGERSTGLGLAIAYRIMQGHHGKIWAESTLGEGSAFFVALPLEVVD